MCSWSKSSVLYLTKKSALLWINARCHTTLQQALADFLILNCIWPLFNLPPVLLTLAANLPPVSTTPAVPVGKFTAAGVIYTGAPWPANISTNFRENSKWPKSYFQGLGGRRFMKKTLKQKSSWHCPFKSFRKHSSSAAVLVDSAVRARTQNYVNLTLW